MMQSAPIFSFNAGLMRNKRPWKILEDAFEILEDAYCHRETVRKRWGYRLIGGSIDRSQFRISAGTTSQEGAYEQKVTDLDIAVGQRILVGDDTLTIVKADNPATLISTNPAITVELNTETKILKITGAAPNAAVAFYPGLPVMGLATQEQEQINYENTIGFDTRYAYERAGGYWNRLGNATWSGTNSNFFWWINHRGPSGYERYVYVTNGNKSDPIRYLAEGTKEWKDLRPKLNTAGTSFLDSCKFLVSFKDRLYAFDVYITMDGVQTRYRNRLIACQNGNPLQEDAWVTDTPGKGFYLDAPTTQAAVQPAYMLDRLLIKFERMTFELVYTGHPNLPVKYQLIDSNRGAESTFSGITRENVHICVGNQSIDASSPAAVQAIDEKIPDEVYKIHNCCESVERVYGCEDNFSELLYWTFPYKQHGSVYPNRLLVYNYRNNSWAFFNDSFTCFGKFQKQNDMIWRTVGNFYPTWSVWNAPWNSGKKQSAFPDIIAGNQQGITFIIDSQLAINAPSLIIANISGSTLTIVDHNLNIGDYIRIEDAGWNPIITRVQTIEDKDTLTVDESFVGLSYKGGGVARRISKFDIYTKEYSFGLGKAQQFRVPEILFLTDTTQHGEYIVDDIQDTALAGSTWDSTERKDYFLGTNIVRTRPEAITPKRVNTSYEWHSFQSYAKGAFVQFRLTLSDDQLRNWQVASSPFVLHALDIHYEAFGSSVERI